MVDCWELGGAVGFDVWDCRFSVFGGEIEEDEGFEATTGEGAFGAINLDEDACLLEASVGAEGAGPVAGAFGFSDGATLSAT